MAAPNWGNLFNWNNTFLSWRNGSRDIKCTGTTRSIDADSDSQPMKFTKLPSWEYFGLSVKVGWQNKDINKN